MTIYEPMTFATDCVLALAAAVFAGRLWRVNRMWALAFLFTAIGSLAGGTYHGFAPLLEPRFALALWKVTVFSIGLTSFYLLAGSGPRLGVVAMVKLIVYISWMIVHDEFVYVIADYGLALLIVGIVRLVWREPSTPWVMASIALSVIAALVQQSRLTLHPHFNYNDLYHVIQLAALWLLYRGGRLMNRSTAPPTNRPR